MATHAELMRTCAPLYPSFALESVASLVLFCFFSYLSILISSKSQLRAPARAICSFLWLNVTDWAVDTYRVLCRWPQMHEMDLGQRFRFCRRLNATICRISAFSALVSITRWLHINNVNGMRYLGYAITCPLMQAELVLLIAPVVPCYRAVVVVTCILTFTMLVSGYTASQFEGELFHTDWQDIILDGNFHNLTTKGMLICPSMLVLGFLSLVQLPVLALLYLRKGGWESGKLPHGYPNLLLLTAVTWWGFPCWWLLSYEGMSILTDTWANGVGFVLLNMISKGGYTLQMLRMVKWFKTHAASTALRDSVSSRDSGASRYTLPPLPDVLPPARSEAKKPSQQSLAWLVEYMKQYEVPGEPPVAEPPETQNVKVVTVKVTDAGQLTNDQLMEELQKRLGAAGDVRHWPTAVSREELLKEDYESRLDTEIMKACAQLALVESEDEE